MKLKRSLKNSAKCVLLLNTIILSFFILGCSAVKPTYLKDDIDRAIQDICKKEYNIDVKAKLVGSTLWVYIPVEDILEKSDKPEKYYERFVIEENEIKLKNSFLKASYKIKPGSESEGFQDYGFNKKVLENVSNVWKVLRRVLFSMDRKESAEPKFFCIIASDIKNGVQLKDTFYLLDLKKVSYDFISVTEYQHRNIQDVELVPEALDDRDGLHIHYKDITFEDFISGQIKHRIKLKFQKPEVEKSSDIDKEVLKIIKNTVQIYGIQDIYAAELNNLFTKNRILVGQTDLLEKTSDKKF